MKRISQLVRLGIDVPWLVDHENALNELLRLTENPSEALLICELLRSFTYYPRSDDFKSALASALEQVVEKWSLHQDDTVFAAAAVDSESDSSHWIAYELKLIARERLQWETPKCLSNCNKVKDYVNDRSNIVLVDEFAGTGKTIANKIPDLRIRLDESLRARGKTIRYKIYVVLVVAMDRACRRIEDEGAEVFALVRQKSALTGRMTGRRRRRAVRDMLRLESRLDKRDSSNVFPFGYGRTQALYGRAGGNAPNNVFPIFWWPRKKQRPNKRRTLLLRAEETHAAANGN